MLRRLLEKVMRNLTITRRIRLKGRSMRIVLSPDARLSYLGPNFDADLLALAEKHVTPGSHSWDVGANCGVFTVAAALCSNTGTTVAVEPDSWLSELIKRTAGKPENTPRDIRVLSAAVAQEAGILKFNIAERGRASNFLQNINGRMQAGGTRRTDYVPSYSLDDLLDVFPQPAFIKMDIEGAEVMALLGAKRMLTEVRPKMYIETSGTTRDAVLQIMADHGFASEQHGKNYLFTPRAGDGQEAA